MQYTAAGDLQTGSSGKTCAEDVEIREHLGVRVGKMIFEDIHRHLGFQKFFSFYEGETSFMRGSRQAGEIAKKRELWTDPQLSFENIWESMFSRIGRINNSLLFFRNKLWDVRIPDILPELPLLHAHIRSCGISSQEEHRL